MIAGKLALLTLLVAIFASAIGVVYNKHLSRSRGS
jgi:cell division protein FtsL